jgi:hypothetical protein
VRGGVGDGSRWRRAAPGLLGLLLPFAGLAHAWAHPGLAQGTIPSGARRVDRGRFTAVAYGADTLLAQSLLDGAVRTDTFPGLPRPVAHVVIAIAPDRETFRRWVGAGAPEWGAGIAIPDENRIVLQGRGAPSSAGDPTVVLRHELAHLALHEYLGDRAPRWFDEGYAGFAAGEGGRDEALATNVALALRGVPTLARVDSGLTGTEGDAQVSYALAYRAVADLAGLDRTRGLSLFFTYWRAGGSAGGSLDHAVRQAYGEPLETFEATWRERVRRRYGALALFSDLTVATLALLMLLAPLYVIRRRRDRERLAALRAADEAAERRARLDAIHVLLESLPPPPTAGEHST